MKRLAGNRSPNWAILQRFEVPNLDDPRQTYLTRWRIIQTPWFGVYLHRMDGPDSRATLHDHPWTFTSIILRGGYYEAHAPQASVGPIEMRCHVIGDVNRMQRYEAHFIRELVKVPTWTLMLVGRRQNTWGYWDPWRDRPAPGHAYQREEVRIWTPYDRHPHAAEFDEAMAERARLGLTRRPWWRWRP